MAIVNIERKLKQAVQWDGSPGAQSDIDTITGESSTVLGGGQLSVAGWMAEVGDYVTDDPSSGDFIISAATFATDWQVR